jgi:hypothetical protein
VNAKLTTSSPARNTGLSHDMDPLVPTDDLDGNPRGAEGRYDRGAFEMQ